MTAASDDERGNGPKIPDIEWIEAVDNPWGVRVLDVRPVTLGMLSWTKDPHLAQNAVSYGNDDGTGFVGSEPTVSRVVAAGLRFPIDRFFADGVLSVPRQVEQKWALFHHQRQIIFVRSWHREVQAVAEIDERGEHVEITAVRGSFFAEDEEPEFTVRVVDYLLRSHALGLAYPAPLPEGLQDEPKSAAVWCMSMFGNRALVATPHAIPWRDPDKPLRTDSLLHIAVAQGNVQAIETCLAAGVPVDLRANDGLAPIHWALACEDPAIMPMLIQRGSPVDARSDEGATALMTAVQSASFEVVSRLLDLGADPNARDDRGFTALHRAAETGKIEMVTELLDRGASPHPEAQGHTPLSLAEGQGEAAIVALLRDRRRPR